MAKAGNRGMPAPKSVPVPPAAVQAQDEEMKPSEEEAAEQSEAAEPKKKKGSGPIEVIAQRDGFMQGVRIMKDEKFSVSSFEDLGEWMSCVDPKLEKMRKAFFVEKKEKAKARAKQAEERE